MLSYRFQKALDAIASACMDEGCMNATISVCDGQPRTIVNHDKNTLHLNDRYGWYEWKAVPDER